MPGWNVVNTWIDVRYWSNICSVQAPTPAMNMRSSHGLFSYDKRDFELSCPATGLVIRIEISL